MGSSGSVRKKKTSTTTATILDQTEERLNECHKTAVQECDIKPHYFVLEIGFDRGHGLWEALQLIKGGSGRMIGTEKSKPKFDKVAFLLQDHITAGNLEIELCEPELLNFVDDMFDCVYNVNGYFAWKNVAKTLREIYRVLRQGCLFLTCVQEELVKNVNKVRKSSTMTIQDYVDELKENDFVKVKIIEHRDAQSGSKYQTVHAFTKTKKYL